MTLQEERLRHLLHQAAPNPTATIDPQAIERRAGSRHRARIVVSALAITALTGASAATLLTVTSGSNSEQRITATPGPREPRPTILTGVGTIIKTAAGPAQLCLGVQFTAATGSFPRATPSSRAPATCPGGVTLRGLLLDQLRGWQHQERRDGNSAATSDRDVSERDIHPRPPAAKDERSPHGAVAHVLSAAVRCSRRRLV